MCHNVKALICIHKAQKWCSTTIPLKPVCLFLIRPFLPLRSNHCTGFCAYNFFAFLENVILYVDIHEEHRLLLCIFELINGIIYVGFFL